MNAVLLKNGSRRLRFLRKNKRRTKKRSKKTRIQKQLDLRHKKWRSRNNFKSKRQKNKNIHKSSMTAIISMLSVPKIYRISSPFRALC
jgi:cytoskeletal protein RodZ